MHPLMTAVIKWRELIKLRAGEELKGELFEYWSEDMRGTLELMTDLGW
jgi:hypothetical protein